MMKALLRMLFSCSLLCAASSGSAMTVNITGTWANCPAYIDGTATANVTGGVAPYSYLWYNGATTQQITGLSPGPVNCTVTDAIGTTAFDTYYLQEANLYFHNGVVNVQPACSGGCSGLMWFDTTNATGGVAPFMFNPPPSYWVGDVAYFEGLCPFQFNYSITDATGCVENTGVPVGSPTYLLGEVIATTPGCNGAANGSASFQAGLYDLPPGITHEVIFNAVNGQSVVVASVPLFVGDITNYGEFTELAPGNYTLQAEFWGYCQPATLSVPFTVPDMGPDCGNIQGSVWYDLDHDCVHDASEAWIPNRVNMILPGPRYAITNANGQYSSGLDYGSYTIEQTSPDLDQICPANSPVPFALDANNQNVYLFFGDTSNIPFDLGTSCYLNSTLLGTSTNAWINVQNGSAVPSDVVTVSYSYSTELTYASSSISPTVNTPGYLEWQLPSIAAYAHTNIHLVFNIALDPNLIGVVVNATATATNAGAEGYVSNNTCTSTRTILAAYDPNEKLAHTSSGLSNTQYFLNEDNSITYTIGFQNTGNAPAATVVLRDTLEAELDPSTLQILGASHVFTPSFEYTRVLKFTFNNINLPDSGADQAASHGYVQFRIRPRDGILLGDVIENDADIYFDINPPVTTNNTALVVEMSTQQAEGPDADRRHLTLFPNPATDELQVIIGDAGVGAHTADVLSMDGRVLMHIGAISSTVRISTASLGAGAYVLRLRNADGRTQQAAFMKR